MATGIHQRLCLISGNNRLAKGLRGRLRLQRSQGVRWALRLILLCWKSFDEPFAMPACHGNANRNIATLLAGHGGNQIKRGVADKLGAPGHGQSTSGGKADTYAREASRPQRYGNAASVSAIGKRGNHRHQALGMAATQ